MSESTTFSIRDAKNSQALILVHGFSGNSHETFGLLPAFLAGDPSLYGWDIHCFGYPTSLKPDVSGVWSADPDLTTLAGFLCTAIEQTRFAGYKRLALIAHSMGGLVVQRAVLDGNFLDRLGFLFLFGTPSDGLRKAGLGRLFKRQARDMTRGGDFIAQLRADWITKIGDMPSFAFRAVAGIRDEFVPRESSVEPFGETLRGFLPGDHLELVKPATASADIVRLLLRILGAKPGQVEVPSPHQALADKLMPAKKNLSEPELRELAFALEGLGRQAEAIQVLEERHRESTDLMGMLAGRLKRRWLADPEARRDDGLRARQLYSDAWAVADAAKDHAQASYNGINRAFMMLALDRDEEGARELAAAVLSHSLLASSDIWSRATQGEAYLYLGDPRAALLAYGDVVRKTWDSRQLDSIQRQAIWAARLVEDAAAEAELQALFGSRAAA